MRERSKESEGAEQVKHEDLGTQTIEGVSAQGKRETVTIPAGQIGNERPIEIVSETWYLARTAHHGAEKTFRPARGRDDLPAHRHQAQ